MQKLIDRRKYHSGEELLRFQNIPWSLLKKVSFCTHVYIDCISPSFSVRSIWCCGQNTQVLNFHLFGQDFISHIQLLYFFGRGFKSYYLLLVLLPPQWAYNG